MFNNLADFIVARPRLVLVVVALAFVGSVLTAPQLDFSFSPQDMFDTGGEAYEYREAYADRFGREDNLVPIIIEGPDVFDPAVLHPMRDLTFELRRIDEIEEAHSVATLSLPRPESLAAEPHLEDPRVGDEDTAVVRGPEVDEQSARRLAEHALDEPIIVDRFVNPDATHAILGAWLDPDIQDADRLGAVVEQIDGIIEHYEFPDDTSLQTQGVPQMRATVVDKLRSEQFLFIPLLTVCFFLILLYLFRRPSGIVLPLGTVALAVTATLAMMVVTGSDINFVNNVLPSLVFIIGIADSIHMITRHAEEVGLGKSHDEAVKETIRHTGAACLLTTTTTAIGFLSLMSANTAILRSFGWQAAAGMGFAFLATLFFVGASLTYMQPARRVEPDEPGGDPPRLERAMMAVGDRILARPWTTLTVGLLLVGAIALQIRNLEVDSYIMDMLDEDHQTRQATRTIEDHLGGLLPLEISLEAERQNTFRRPEVYRAVHDLQQYMDQQSHVLSTQSYVDYLQTARVAVVGDRDERDVLPDSRDQIEQLLVLIADAPDADDELSDFVTSDWSNARILGRVEGLGARAHMQLAEQLEAEIDELFGDDDNITVHITGDAYVASAALSTFTRDLLVSLTIAMVLIFGLMTLVFRSIKIGIVSLLPNLTPLVVAAGYMGWSGIYLNSTTLVIFAIGLGIAVDDSIHFFARFFEERKRRDDLREAILQTYHGAGRAIMMSSILLLVGMAVLRLSDFLPTQQFSTLIAIIVGGAILADLLLLPVVLYLLYSKFPGKQGPNHSARPQPGCDQPHSE